MSRSLEELTKLASALAEEAQSGSVRCPYPRFFINYDPEVSAPGQFAVGGEKDEEGNWTTAPTVLGKEARVIFLKEYGQYTYFDPQAEKITVKSNIFPKFKAKEAVDLFTEKPISELKEVYPSIRYTQVTLVLARLKNAWTPAVWYMRGASLKACLDMLRENKLKPKDYIAQKVFAFGTEKHKKGTVLYYTPKLITIADPTEAEAKQLLKLIPETVNVFRQYVDEYNGISYPATSIETEEGIADDDLQF